MSKVLTVAWREFLETVRTRAFFFGVILMPALLLGAIFATDRISKITEKEVQPPKLIAVVDHHGQVFAELARKIDEYNEQRPQQPLMLEQVDPGSVSREKLVQRVNDGHIYAYLWIPAEAVTGDAEVTLGRRDSQLRMRELLARMLREAVTAVRFATADPPIDVQRVAQLQRGVPVASVDVGSGQKTTDDELVRVLTPFAVMFLLYMGTFGISWGLLTSVLEEKNSRVVEVLLSACSPTQLMAGKILGMVLVGVLMLAIWAAVGVSAAHARGVTYALGGLRLVYVLLYFIPGFLLMASVLGAIGAACNTLKDAQSMASPLSLLNIVPMVLWFQISQNPASMLSMVLSFIPPITPFVMVLRICTYPGLPLWEIIATQVVLWASVVVMIWAAGKVFRVGLLMYGKPPSPSELLRWIRYA